MDIASHKGVAHTHRVYDRLNVINLSSIQTVGHGIIQHTGQGVMGACQLIAQSHNHLLALGEQLVHFAEIILISLPVDDIAGILRLKRNVLYAACHLPFVLVAKRHVAILHHIV